MSPDTNRANAQPQKWWQWFIVYPALVISLISAIPTFVELYKAQSLGVEFGTSAEAAEQEDLWKDNLGCMQEVPLDPLTTESNLKVDAVICNSGDVLVQVFAPDGKKAYRWVSAKRIIAGVAYVWSLGSEAYASTGLQYGERNVICQRSLGPGRVLRRISIQGQGCIDEEINTYTGAVIRTTNAPCDPNC